MLRSLYDYLMNLAQHKRASWALAAVSFAESSFFPIPPDVMLIPMVVAKKAKAWFYAFICTVSSVLGGIAGYAIGFFLFDSIGKALFDFYGYADKYEKFATTFNDYGAWAVLIAGVTPFPYKVITIASGFTGLDIVTFIVASIVARGLRFYLVAGLLYFFGPAIREFIEKRLGLVTIVFTVLLIGGFVAIKYLH